MVRAPAADAAAVQGHSGSGERAFGYSRRAHASQPGMLSPLVQVVQLVLVSGAEEAQSQLAAQRVGRLSFRRFLVFLFFLFFCFRFFL